MVDEANNATESCGDATVPAVAYSIKREEVSVQPATGDAADEAKPENSRVPCEAYCKDCDKKVTTCVEMEVGTYANLWCCLICLLGGGILCLCYIPYCKDSFLDAVHTCPECEEEIGTCKRYEC